MDTVKISTMQGKIEIITGLYIGVGNESIEIGGIDRAVIKDPMSGYPYIPGSSIKGKIRSLLELTNGKKYICKCGGCDICRVFGNISGKPESGITRAIFRDCFLTEESKRLLLDRNILATEAKMENTINRVTGTASNPRTTERVIPGLFFNFEVSLRIFSNDGNEPTDLIKKGLSLLEKDALGGSGSRGYGKIRFIDLTVDGKPFSLAGAQG